MKKTISLILALAMILSCVALAACSGGGSSAPAAIEAKQSEDKYAFFF